MSTASIVAIATAAVCQAETRIQHEAPACFLAESFARLSAVIAPADQVVRARVLFRPETPLRMPTTTASSSRPRSGGTLSDTDPLDGGGGDRSFETPASTWYAVAMTRQGETFSVVLPRPRMAAGKVRYFIEVTDTSAASVRDKERVVEVVGGQDACGDGKPAETVASAQVVVEVPPGAPLVPPVPQGFSPIGASAVEGTRLAPKGGHKGLLLVLGGVAAAGVASSQLLGSPPVSTAVAEPPPPRLTDVVFLSSSPSPGSVVRVGTATFSVLLRIVIPEPSPVVTVRARPYYSRSPTLQCGTLQGSFTGLPANTSQDVNLVGLRGGAPCGFIDRMHVSVENDQGREMLATGTPSRPDLATNYFFTP